MIEAMACGTPVIAYNRGSVPEIIDDGLTGFIVEDEISAVAAVGRLARTGPRRHPQAFRGALHGAPHGAGLSRGLSQPDRGGGAADQAGQQRGVTLLIVVRHCEERSDEAIHHSARCKYGATLPIRQLSLSLRLHDLEHARKLIHQHHQSASRTGLPLTLIFAGANRFLKRRQLRDHFVEHAVCQREAGVGIWGRRRHRSARNFPD